jgi:dTDP-4-dehydrorhamnose 3,5-epimerase/reductase
VTVDESALLIVGSGGQLGTALQARYPGAQAVARPDIDITSATSLAAHDWSGIKFVVNAAAYTNVDGAETADGRIAAWQVNAVGARNLAEVATRRDITLVHISTDYVFDGTQDPHTEDEQFSPLGVYGQSKAAGDLAVGLTPKHYLLRTSWVIGDGKNFVRTMIALGRKGVSPGVVGDQIGRLTFTDEIARAIDHLLFTGSAYGTYNVSNAGDVASWADVARAVFALGGFDAQVSDVTTEQYFVDAPEAAPRPLRSSFDLGKLQATGFEPADWHTELERYVAKELAQ